VRFAPDGGAVPGDRIVGIMTPARGSHLPIQSHRAEGFEDDARSAGSTCAGTSRRQSPQRFPARHRGAIGQRAGHARPGRQVIAEHDAISTISAWTRQSPDFTELQIDLEVYDLKHLTAIIAQLKAKKWGDGSSG
jgi:(p)ppGpp synthase/HD superfamily hydrolase